MNVGESLDLTVWSNFVPATLPGLSSGVSCWGGSCEPCRTRLDPPLVSLISASVKPKNNMLIANSIVLLAILIGWIEVFESS